MNNNQNNNQDNQGFDYNYFQNFDYGDGNDTTKNVQMSQPVVNPQVEQNTEQYIRENSQSYDQLYNNYIQNENKQETEQKKVNIKIRKSWIIAGISIIFVAIIAIIVVNVFFGSKMTDPIDDLVEYANKHEYDWKDYMQVCDYGPIGELHIMYEEFDEQIYRDAVHNNDYYERVIAALENAFGDDYELTYEITGKERVKGEDLDKFKDDVEEYFDDAVEDLEVDEMVEYYEENRVSVSSAEKKRLEKQYREAEKWVEKLKIGKVYDLEVEFTIEGESGEDKFKYESITVAKINDQWMAFSEYDMEYEESGYYVFSLMPYDIANALDMYISYYEDPIY